MWTHAYLHTPTDTTHWFQLQDKRLVYYRLSSQSWAEKPEHYRHKVAAAVTTSYSPCWSLLRLCNKCGGCNLHITVTYNKVFMDYVNMAETFIKHRVSLWVYCAPHGNELQEPSYWHFAARRNRCWRAPDCIHTEKSSKCFTSPSVHTVTRVPTTTKDVYCILGFFLEQPTKVLLSKQHTVHQKNWTDVNN